MKSAIVDTRLARNALPSVISREKYPQIVWFVQIRALHKSYTFMGVHNISSVCDPL